MPYIKDKDRQELRQIPMCANVAGELNYRLTLVIIEYIVHKGLSYQTCNDIVGALGNAKHEFRRRIQDPYETKAINRNGDVYGDVLALLDTLPS